MAPCKIGVGNVFIAPSISSNYVVHFQNHPCTGTITVGKWTKSFVIHLLDFNAREEED